MEEDIALSGDFVISTLVIMDLKNLITRVEALAARSRSVSGQLGEIASALERGEISGVGPIISSLTQLDADFNKLRADVATIEPERPSNVSSAEFEAIPSLPALIQILVRMQEDEASAEKAEFSRQREQALAVLASCLRLVHVDAPEVTPLAAYTHVAREVARAIEACQWPDAHADVVPLASGNHPLAAVVQFVRDSDSLSDEDWERLRNVIAEHFGHALAIAASRGKLRFADQPLVLAPSATSPEDSSEIGAVHVEVAPPPEEVTSGPVEIPPNPQPSVEQVHEATVPMVSTAGPAAIPPPGLHPRQVQELPVSTVEKISPPSVESPPDLWHRINNVILRLIGSQRSGLGCQLAKYTEVGQPVGSVLPSWLVEAVALGPCVRFPEGEIAQMLREDFAQFDATCFRGGDGEWDHAIRFLVAAAALRPALLAPGTAAATVLYQLHFSAGLQHLFTYCQRAASFGDHKRPLEPDALKKVQDAAAWHSEVEDLRARTESWFARAPQMGIKYAPAGRVWRTWLQKGQLVWNLLRPIREDDGISISEMERLISKWSNRNELDRHVRHTDRDEIRRVGGKEITADALFQLRRHAFDAVELLRSWVELQKHRPGQERSHSGQEQEIESLRADLEELEPRVIDELQIFQNQNPSMMIGVGATACQTTVRRIGELFDAALPITASEPSVDGLLRIDLLRVPSLRMNEAWEPEWTSPESALVALEELAEGPLPSWRKAFERHCEQGDHLSTLRILGHLEQEPQTDLGTEAIQELQALRARKLRECQDALEQDAETTRRELEKAVAFGLVTEKDRIDMGAIIESVIEGCARVLEFAPQHKLLADIRQNIERRRTQQVEEARQRLAAEVTMEQRARDRIRKVLDSGDVLTAHEYIDMVRQNLDLPERAEQRDAFREFFPEGVRTLNESLEKFFENHHVGDLAALIKNRRSFGGVEMAPVSGAEAERAAKALEVWFEAKRRKNEESLENHVRDLLGFLGFQGASVVLDRSRRGMWMNIRTVPITQREQCPIPRFGSEANGHYRLLCVWDRPNEEDLVNEVADALVTPVLVFFFGRLADTRRRNLAKLCRERRRTLLVLDEILMLHLCGVAGSRAPVFFDCAVPFTYVETYVTSAGVVPPEMFYGRKAARDSVLAPKGSCFIYGGRQLGKTALLRAVERRFHSPDHGQLALWLDLNARGIGKDRPIDDLWIVIEDELAKFGVLKKKTRGQVDKLLNTIADWILEDSERRILLLLDEADRFLELDGKKEKGGEFIRAARLKGLMDRTDRRFKVVFAGLHNVQRTTTSANHPLAHYGTPICVGPLFENGEWRDARALIEAPFASMGYRFDNPDLVTRVLSQTNYYPNLIQLYGQKLFLHLIKQNMNRPDWRTAPPFVITARDVEDAYRGQDLRKDIRDRFIWTLQLDKRYEVIAYAIGYAVVGDELEEAERTRFALEGFPVSWIQREALEWWEDGFGDNFSEDSFRVLLDEMVGLGILRCVGNRYGLRSPNVVALMGTVDEIAAKLVETRERETDYPPAVARALCSPEQRWRRSPLAGRQEDTLKERAGRVSIIIGTEAAGLPDVLGRIGAMFRDSVKELENLVGRAELRCALSGLYGGKPRDSTERVVMIPANVPWTEEWVSDALEFQRTHRQAVQAQVIFLAGPEAVWAMLGSNTNVFDQFAGSGVNVLSLTPWHEQAVREWLDECGFTTNPDDRKRVRELTGSWPLLLYRFYESCHGDMPHWSTYLDKLKTDAIDQDRENLRKAFGLTNCPGSRVVASLAIISPASEEYLVASVQEPGWPELVRRALEWGRRLNLLTYSTQGRWAADPIVQQLAQEVSI